jgi:hypothetical protein
MVLSSKLVRHVGDPPGPNLRDHTFTSRPCFEALPSDSLLCIKHSWNDSSAAQRRTTSSHARRQHQHRSL